ncbi:hypothetical protein MA16_Dca009663 [Dendrobium catenatum]|uniref:Uncharacterized protein n=1 Tax=Dendrobium catenatum TaxID=906689 RepID=A0A2I0VSN5_9ASPA|nr:hypothetical protein MA16_Dca009663 [Dendrobium catenatum]
MSFGSRIEFRCRVRSWRHSGVRWESGVVLTTGRTPAMIEEELFSHILLFSSSCLGTFDAFSYYLDLYVFLLASSIKYGSDWAHEGPISSIFKDNRAHIVAVHNSKYNFSVRGMPLPMLGLGIGGGCGVGFGLGWGFGSGFGSQYRSSKVIFDGIQFDAKGQSDKSTVPASSKVLEN